MKIDLYYPELKLWLTFWAEKPSPFDALTRNQKGMLRQDVLLAVIGFLGKTDFPAVESGDIKDAERRRVRKALATGLLGVDANRNDAEKRKDSRMPEGEDGFVGQ